MLTARHFRIPHGGVIAAHKYTFPNKFFKHLAPASLLYAPVYVSTRTLVSTRGFWCAGVECAPRLLRGTRTKVIARSSVGVRRQPRHQRIASGVQESNAPVRCLRGTRAILARISKIKNVEGHDAQWAIPSIRSKHSAPPLPTGAPT